MSEFTFIEAANGKKPKVSGVAYSGGKMDLGWPEPVVVDLTGIVIPETVPLLTNHNNKTECRIGMVRAEIKNNTLVIEGEIQSEGKEAQNIVEQAKAGADWQLSIGADVKQSELVKGNLSVNGQEQTGPFYLVKQSVLREVSVVAVGADQHTTLKVAAKFQLNQGEEEMAEQAKQTGVETGKSTAAGGIQAKAPETGIVPEKTGETPDVKAAAAEAVKKERERVSAIQGICNGEFPEIEKQAVSAGWTPEATTTKVLETLRAGRPAANVHISVKPEPSSNETRRSLEAALCLRSGVSADDLEKSYGAPAVEAGMKSMDVSLRELCIECAGLDGIAIAARGFDNDSIRAAFSSVSLPGILSNVANKRMLQSFESQPVIATKLCSSGDLNDFKENDRYRLTDVGDLQPVAADGEIKEGGLSEEKAINQLDTYGKKFCLTRKMIINDDLGAFMKVPTAMGNRAARLIDQLFFSRLLQNPNQADGKPLFHNGHNNLLSGATSALGVEALKKAIQKFLDQTDSDGQPICVEPRFLLVPNALKHLAVELTQGATLITGTDNTLRPALNVLSKENLEVVSSPYLGNSAYANNSQSAWYLFGDPKTVDTWEIGYLKGKRTPTVERGETDFNTLGLWFRVYFDLGVHEQDYRGMVKAVGA